MTKRQRIERAIEGVLIIHGALAAIFAMLTVGWLVLAGLAALDDDMASQPLATILAFIGFVPVVLVAIQRRSELARGGATDRLKALYFIASGLALAGAWIFFNGIAHDLFLLMGFHGRFGCHTVDAAGQGVSFFDEDTVPWVFFVPAPMLMVLLLWLRSRGP